ncbi:MAG: M16 family metallopeptidase [bacterium JZ-2024 1]
METSLWDVSFTEYRLANGMEIAVVENQTLPVVALQLWYRIGSACDFPGKSGLAHFLEHMMFKGTGRLKEEEFSLRIQKWGGECNAFTSEDSTVYVSEIPSAHWKEVLEMEADRMVSLRLRHFEEEKKVIMEERRRTMENQPQAILYEQVRSAMFTHHPYRNPIIGWMEELKSIQKEEMLRFYRSYYHPGNAFLTVVGDVDTEEVFSFAERVFGDIPAQQKSEEREVNEPLSEKHIRVRRPGLASFVYDSYRLPAPRKAPLFALELLAIILGEGLSSRLHSELIEKQKIASSVDVDVSWLAQAGSFSFTLFPMQDVPYEKVIQATYEVLNQVRAEGVSDWELDKAKSLALSKLILEKESNEALAYYLGRLHILDSWHRIHTIYEEITSVTREDVVKALNEYIIPDLCTRGIFEAIT